MMQARHIDNAELTDSDLLRLYKTGGDQSILAALYMRYTDLVFGVALKYLQERESAKDAVMAIYQELVSKLQTHEVDNFKSWLHVLTKNHCLMKLRKDKKTPVIEFQADHMQSEDFEHLDSVLEKEKEFRVLEKCIGRLNEEQRNVIKKFYLEEKCYNEIIEHTGLDWNKVRSLLQNGRRNLKICMEKNAAR